MIFLRVKKKFDLIGFWFHRGFRQKEIQRIGFQMTNWHKKTNSIEKLNAVSDKKGIFLSQLCKISDKSI